MSSDSEIELEDGTRIETRGCEPESVAFLKSKVHAGVGPEEFGEVESTQRLIKKRERYNPTELRYWPIHAAALRKRADAAEYLIKNGADVNATNPNGRTALHWSAVKGDIPVTEILLQNGARVGAADNYGMQAAHLAAQNGHANFLVHIVTKWNAEIDVPDNDGRSPLHWAAFKGSADCIRLLLFLDAYRGRRDNGGMTSLHFAAVGGKCEACRVLVQGGNNEDLMVRENRGYTAEQIAVYKKHRQVADFLGNASRLCGMRCDGNSHLGKVGKFGLAPVVWVLTGFMLYTYIHSVFTAPSRSHMPAGHRIFAISGIVTASFGFFLFILCSCKDPGFIKTNIRDRHNVMDYKSLLNMKLNHPALLAGNWSRLCATCKIVRPQRARHCTKCVRCVEQCVGHCTWVSNCIGKRNKRVFVMFLVFEVVTMVVTGVVTFLGIHTDPNVRPRVSFRKWMSHAAIDHAGALFFLIADLCILFVVSVLIVVKLHSRIAAGRE